MKHIFLPVVIIVLSFAFQPLDAQKKKQQDEAELFYVFNKDWTSAKDFASATYFMQVVKANDTNYICRYYNKFGPMAKQESFKDEQLTIPNGLFCWYSKEGYVDSIGSVKEGRKDWYWNYYRTGKRYLTLRYNNGRLLEKEDFDADIYTDSTGKQSRLKEKLLQDSLHRDSVVTEQVKAKFNGDWSKYMSKNVKTPDRFEKVMGRGSYDAIVSFLVDKEGNITDVYLTKSCEWSADAELMRVIQNAPKWIPAQQNGQPVIYRQIQRITFNVESN